MALRGQFSSNIIYEIKMTGQIKKDEKPPMMDIWRKHIELDHRNFNPDEMKYGQLFLKDDRDLANQNVRKVIEMHLVPHIASKIAATE